MSDLVKLTQNIPASTFLTWCLCIFSIIGAILALSIKIYSLFKKWHVYENEKEENENIMLKNRESVITLENKLDTFMCTFEMFIEKDKQDKQSIIRNMIQEMYNKALVKRYIIDEDKKNFGYLHERYVANGGNSYVNDTIKPYIDSLQIFKSDEEAEKYHNEHGTYK